MITFKNAESFEDIINRDFLEENIMDMIKLNIPFPHSLVDMIKDPIKQDTINELYMARTFENKLFLYAFKHGGIYGSDWEDWFDMEFKILNDFITKAPKFRGLIK